MTPGRNPSISASAFSTMSQQSRYRGWVLEVHHDFLPCRALTSLHDQRLAPTRSMRINLRAHVRQHHAAHGGGPDAGEFDDAESSQRAGNAGGGLRG